ncbi:MAG: hypothetical protein M3462_07815 [Chloroflexota bacterium]|nr:hypothetical protein [Chloroflexota bacterium]
MRGETLRADRVPLLAFLTHLALVTLTAVLTVRFVPSRTWVRPDLGGWAGWIVAPLAIWDGGWYAEIAGDGYGGRRERAAFWPLYPLLLRGAAWLTGAGVEVAGVVISNLALLVALVALHRLVRADLPGRVADRAVWLVALLPNGFVFSAVYTESLFLALSASSLLAARRGRWVIAVALAALAAVTRNTGLLVLIPLAALAVGQAGWRPGPLLRLAWPLALVPLAPAIFLWHLENLWGDPLLPMRVGAHWDRHPTWPWRSLWTGTHTALRAYRDWFTGGDLLPAPGEAPRLIGLPAVGVALVLLPRCWHHLGWGYTSYAVACLLVPLASPAGYNGFLSVPRYLLPVFPLWIAAATLPISTGRWRVLLVALATGQAVLFFLHASGYFVA